MLRTAHRHQPIPSYIGQVATRSYVPTHNNVNSSDWMIRSFHFARDRITSVRMAFANWYVNPGAGPIVETANGSACTLGASIETSGGKFYQCTFNGATSVSVASGTTVWTDWLSVGSIEKGDKFFVRQRRTGATAISYNQDGDGAHAYSTGGDAFEQTSTDKLTSGTVVAQFTNISAYPVAIVAQTRRASIAIVGDSRQAGRNDLADATGDQGELSRALGGSFGYMNLAVVGEHAWEFSASCTLRKALLPYCSHVIVGHGINDVVEGASLATIQSRVQAVAALAAPRPVYAITLSPYSTGAWTAADGSDQTIRSDNTVRVNYNNWLRGPLPAGFNGFLEVADSVELSRDVGKWKAPGYTDDGLHELTFGNQQVSLPTGRFALTGAGPLAGLR